MKTKIFIIAAVFISLFTQCHIQEDVFLTKEEFEEWIDTQIVDLGHIVYVSDDEIFYTAHIDERREVEKINAPAGTKGEIRISHSGEKIAYLNENGNPVIINRAGEVLAELSEYTNIHHMDWSGDDKTLYMFIDGEFYFYGPAIELPEMYIPLDIPLSFYDPEIVAAAISPEGDLVYSVRYLYAPGSYTNRLIVMRKGEEPEELQGAENMTELNYLKFSSTGSLVAGFRDYYGGRQVLRVRIYPDLSDLENVMGREGGFNNPVYRSDLSLLFSYTAHHIFIKELSSSSSDYVKFYGEDYNPDFADWK